jgi:hypothetical protein
MNRQYSVEKLFIWSGLNVRLAHRPRSLTRTVLVSLLLFGRLCPSTGFDRGIHARANSPSVSGNEMEQPDHLKKRNEARLTGWCYGLEDVIDIEKKC